MGIKVSGGFCKKCNKDVMTHRNTPNHILHLLLAVVTVGLWLIVWIILILFAPTRGLCTECGGQV